jgi:hypothetical protein
MPLVLKAIEQNIRPIGGKSSYDKEFIFALLTAYGRSASNITRLRNGSLNVADDPSRDVAQKSVVYFRPVTDGASLYEVIDDLKTSPTVVRYSTRFVIVTDYENLLAIDAKTGETLDTPIRSIHKHYTFFLPWAGMEKAQYTAESHADIKAAYKMSKLFDEIVAYNHHNPGEQYYHSLNVFFSRLLFCFFAEDTEIFKPGQFTSSIESHTQNDGSDMADYLNELFAALDIEDKSGHPAHISNFPYVNGGLFRSRHDAPNFNSKARALILECGKLNWSEINPDIFGSMIQAVVHPGQRAGLGMHYTSVPNILKTIEPLFLDSLKDDFNKYFDDKQKLQKLLDRVGKIKIFDPACGSGNFLVIAYKELRKLEHAILERIYQLSAHKTNLVLFSRINIEHFYGIEIDDFACEVAVLSLWLAKHQMNVEFKQKFGPEIPLIPLKEAGNIVHGNAARLDWNKVCPNIPRVRGRLLQGKLIQEEMEQAQLLDVDSREWDEIYLISNPPYQGAKKKDDEQTEDYRRVFGNTDYPKNLDYISLWLIKGARYIAGTKATLAFVSTNSICQGDHVALLWPYILKLNLEIGYAYTSFPWENNAKANAGVTCIIVSLREQSKFTKYIFASGLKQEVGHINPYLAASDRDIIVARRSEVLSGLPPMVFGSMPRDGGNLILSPREREEMIMNFPNSRPFIKRYIGSAEYIRGINRYCLWITDEEYPNANSVPAIHERLEKVRQSRAQSDALSTQSFGSKPYRFVQISYQPTPSIIVPRVSSVRREYIPMGYLDADSVISDLAFAIYDAQPFVFGLLSSHMHMVWVKTVAGRMKTDIRYSSGIVYNNFPVPAIGERNKEEIQKLVFAILDARERHSEKTLSEMYDPDKMPEDLLIAHQDLDSAIELLYRKKPFANDEERLALLFDLYETLTINETIGTTT